MSGILTSLYPKRALAAEQVHYSARWLETLPPIICTKFVPIFQADLDNVPDESFELHKPF